MTDYEVEIEFLSAKRRIQGLMEENCFLDAIKERGFLDSIHNSNSTACRYYDIQEFISLGSNQPENLNIFLLNISSLSKHHGNLVCFLNSLETHFQIIVLMILCLKAFLYSFYQ